MGPLGFLTGVVLGSAVSIAGVLAMVLVIFMLSSGDHPALVAEYPGLVRAIVLFTGLSIVSAIAFFALQRKLHWRWYAQVAMWAALVAVAWSYWPSATA
jgi:hypothetical protein